MNSAVPMIFSSDSSKTTVRKVLLWGMGFFCFWAISGVGTTHLEQQKNILIKASSLQSSLKIPAFPFPAEFRGIVSDWAYVHADQSFHSGKWNHILPYLRLRATIAPEKTDSWSTGAWHLAFNLSEQAKTSEGKKLLIDRGIAFLNEGIQKHPDVAHLYFDLAWTYYMRLNDFQSAERLFRIALSHQYDRRTIIWLAYLYHKQGKFKEEITVWKDALKYFPGDKKVAEHLKVAEGALLNSLNQVSAATVKNLTPLKES